MEKLVLDQKQGFSVNTINLWKNQGKKLCEQYLVEGEVVENGLINKEWILKHITKNDLDVRYVNKFFGLLAFEIWFRLFISKSMKSSEKITI
jgi:asparagine synthase (glutamine-hydrolysing)